MAIVTAADPTGNVIFGRSYPDPGNSFKYRVLRWERGKPIEFDFPGLDQAVDSVNAAGLGVGVSFDGTDTPTAYLYRHGAVTTLPGGRGAIAHGINANNTIVGELHTEAGIRPVIWPSPTSAPRELAVPSDASGGIAHAIDDDGTVVGEVFTNTKGDIAYAWGPDGTGRVLPPPGGEQSGFGSAAFTVRNGWATGIDRDFLSAGDEKGVRWNLGADRVEPVHGMLIRPSMANASGWMVGTDLQGRGVLFAGDRTVVLPDAFQHEPGTFDNLPTTVSDDGRVIAGQADDAGGVIHAVIWHCL
jgi:hypothetical protein